MRSEGWRQRDGLILLELANMLWGRRALVGGCVLVMTLAAVAVGFFQGATHVAEATISIRPEEEINSDQNPKALAARVMDSVPEPQLSREAMRKAGWRGSIAEFNERLNVEPAPNAREIQVEVSASTPEEASRAANAYAQSFVIRIEDLSRRRLAVGALATEAEVIREAAPSAVSTRGPLLYGAAACAAGLVLGSAGALLSEGRTRKWRGARDAELTLRAPVLGTIPHYGAEERVG